MTLSDRSAAIEPRSLGEDYARRLDEIDELLDRAEAIADDAERRSAAMIAPPPGGEEW